MLTTHPSQATIVGILERRSGTEYHSVNMGSVYPCKLKVKIQNTGKEITTVEEAEPCARLITDYYRIGNEINIFTNGRIGQELNPVIGMIISALVFSAGLVIYIYRKRLVK